MGKTKHLVVGYGEVGRGIAGVLRDEYEVLTLDQEEPFLSKEVAVLHICFPYSPLFKDYVEKYKRLYDPCLTIIHSTVPVGTSRSLDAVHSPVTGKHPNLEQSIRTFVKFFSGAQAEEAAEYFAPMCNTLVVDDQETTEAGKLWQTLQYGILIALQKECYKFAEENNADPTIVYDAFNTFYNLGYETLGEPYRLPILRDMPGPIGGHCVIPNAALTDTKFARDLLRFNETYQEDE